MGIRFYDEDETNILKYTEISALAAFEEQGIFSIEEKDGGVYFKAEEDVWIFLEGDGIVKFIEELTELAERTRGFDWILKNKEAATSESV